MSSGESLMMLLRQKCIFGKEMALIGLTLCSVL